LLIIPPSYGDSCPTLRDGGVRSQKKDTHTPKDLLLAHHHEIAGFLKGD
jgi:hypothetical protein